ncbi:MAG TPA: SDR family oxidoreductase [Gaiellaceae bacterium]|jgi:NAD(P)-dependent dehydrogenase (short-subunit alcohol dehydrogenase family)
MTADLDGGVAIVTGAHGRLGPVWIAALASAGMRVAGVDVASGDVRGAELVAEADVTDAAALRGVRERVERELGTPTVLVNNAGIDQPPDPDAAVGGIEGVSPEQFLRVLDVNARGTFVATQAFGPAMVAAGRGSIVNIGSLYASIAPEPQFYDHLPGFVKPPAYAASKAGVVALTRYFARLWGPHGVRVNTLSPGGVSGDQDDEFRRKYCSRVPLGRMAEPADLTGPLLFLASDASRYLTGHELRVDGGFTA